MLGELQMEVPGQYLNIKEPMPEQHVKVGPVLLLLLYSRYRS